MTTTLLLARHVRVGSKYEGRYLGRTDVPLGRNAESEIDSLAKAIRPFKPDIIFSSPMQRTGRTAEGIANFLKYPLAKIEYREDLREVDFGRWEGQSFREIVDRDPELVKQWASWSDSFCFPDGERIGGFVRRVANVVEYACGLSEDVVLIVTHGGVVRIMLCHLLGLPLKNYLLFDVKPASLAVMRVFAGRCVLAGMNLGISGGK